MTSRISIAVFLVLIAPWCQAASAIPDRFAANFVLKAFGATVGKSQWRLAPIRDGRFVWESRTQTAGLALLVRDVTITERSEAEHFEQSFRPLVYRYDRTGDQKARAAEIAFDWQNGSVRNTVKGKTWRMPVPAGTLDRMSYVLALMRDLAAGKREMRYSIADGGKLKTYDMREVGRETLETALGSLETIKMQRIRHDDRETIMWCAPALGFLPVKVTHKERDGWSLTTYIESVEGIGSMNGTERTSVEETPRGVAN